MEKTKYYKVVKPNFKSLVQQDLPNDLKVQYRIGEFVKPKLGRLFVYNRIPDIEDRNEYIFECDVINPIRTYFRLFSFGLTHSRIERFWEYTVMGGWKNPDIAKYYNFELYGEITDAPEGTFTCDAVMLIRRVDGNGNPIEE